MLKKLFIATLLLASSSASAGIINATATEASFGVHGDATNVGVNGDFQQLLSLDGFDNTLGKLLSVSIFFEGSFSANGTITNLSNDAFARGTFAVNSEAYTVKASTSGKEIIAEQTLVEAKLGRSTLLSGESSPEDTYELAPNTAWSLGSPSTEIFKKAFVSTTNLSDFITNDAIVFDFSSWVNTSAQAFINSGESTFEGKFQTGAYGKVSMQYTYDDSVVVSEPGTLAIFGLVLIGFAASRKKKSV